MALTPDGKGHRFEPQQRHCIVVIEQDIYPSLVLVQPRKTYPYITERLLIGSKESNQTKTNNCNLCHVESGYTVKPV